MSKEKWTSILQKEISQIVRLEIKNKYVNSITITGIDLTQDYSFARIHFHSNYPGKLVQEESTKVVPVIKAKLAKKINLRKIPQLIFMYDATLENANRIDSIIDGLNTEKDNDEGDKDGE
ncbi:MAG: 30S ribosome-binding factor RbfA [Mycoplasma sp.]